MGFSSLISALVLANGGRLSLRSVGHGFMKGADLNPAYGNRSNLVTAQ